MNHKDLTGMRFGRLVVVSFSHTKDGPGRNLHYWNCVCDCGNTKKVLSWHLSSGKIQSCRCLQKERVAKATYLHGMSKTVEHGIWMKMKDRCSNPDYKEYHLYGGRGIRVCKRWERFINFYEDMGPRPQGMSIDRRDNNKGYSPANCRWVDSKTQARNTRTNRRVRFNGETKTLSAWCEELGLPYKKTHNRIHALGWSVRKAFTKI